MRDWVVDTGRLTVSLWPQAYWPLPWLLLLGRSFNFSKVSSLGVLSVVRIVAPGKGEIAPGLHSWVFNQPDEFLELLRNIMTDARGA